MEGCIVCIFLIFSFSPRELYISAHVLDSWNLSWIYIPISRTAGSYSNSVFNFLRNCQNVFHIRCTILQSCQQCITVPCSPYPYQHLLLNFLIMATVVSIKWSLTVVLICICLMANDGKHLFHGLIGHLCIFFGEMFIQTLCPTLELGYLSFIITEL